MPDRLSAIFGSLVFALLIFAVAKFIHFLVSRNDERKRIQGAVAAWWVASGYVVGAFCGTFLADNQRYHLNELVGGLGGFGLLSGWVLGMVHGWFRLRDWDSAAKDEVVEHTGADASNPYVPPGHVETSEPN